LSKKKRKSYSREFKKEAVALINEKGYSIAEASRNLGIEYSVLRRWKTQLDADPQNAFPGKGKRSPDGQAFKDLQRELQRVKEERDILKKALAYFAEDQK
jgi:transposase